MGGKKYISMNVLDAARDRISKAFDETERQYVAFSGGKDSSVLFTSSWRRRRSGALK